MRCPHCGKNSIFPEGYCIFCSRPLEQPVVISKSQQKTRTDKSINRRQKRVLSEADKDNIQATYKTHTARQTAELLGFSYNTVRKVIHERNAMRETGKYWNSKKAEKILSSGMGDAIASTYKTHTLQETSRILSMSRPQIRDFLAYKGLLRVKGGKSND
jgi:hypothetical protein